MPFDYQSIDLEGILARLHDQMSPLQRPGVGKARSSGRVLFNVWMGVGKTMMGLASGLCYKPQVWLIIGSKPSLNNWRNEVKKWIPELSAPELFQIVAGTPGKRQEQYTNQHALFFATTAGSFIRDIEWLKQRRTRFDVITIDEPQKFGLRNRNTAGFKSIKDLITHIESRFRVKLINAMTGTWTSKGPPQMWPMLNILEPSTFRSYWKFVRQFCIVHKGMFGTEILGPQNTEGLALITSPYVYTVSEKEASAHLPPLQRILLPVELSSQEQLTYDQMLYHMFIELDSVDEVLTVQTILAKTMRLRQIVCCPQILDPSLPVGSAIETIIDKIKESDELPNWRHNVVYTPFLPSLAPFRAVLSEQLDMPLPDIMIVRGGMDTDDLDYVEKRFRRDPNTMILASLKASQAWNAETALNCYFAGFEWDQDENKQAEGRTRRTDGVQQLIRAYYCHVPQSITADMLDILNHKEYMNKITYQAVQRIAEKLRHQALAKTATSKIPKGPQKISVDFPQNSIVK